MEEYFRNSVFETTECHDLKDINYNLAPCKKELEIRGF